jgi:hypothetical protein
LPPVPVAALASPRAPSARVESPADTATVMPNSSIQRVLDALKYVSKLLTLLGL